MRTVRERRIARPLRPGNAARRNFGKGKTPGLPGSALRGIPRHIAASGLQNGRACERLRMGREFVSRPFIISCKAAVVSAVLGAEGGKGGARPRQGRGIRCGPEAPRTGPPGGRAPRLCAAVGRTAKERGLYRSGGKGRATGCGGPFHCRVERGGAARPGWSW